MLDTMNFKNTKLFCVVAAMALLPACKKDRPPAEEGSTAEVAAKPATTATGTTGQAAADPAAAGEAPAADDYQGLDVVPGAGTISGSVSYTGKEADTKVTITKDDATCCAACAVKEKMAGSLVVSGGKLANAVIYMPEIKKGKKMEKTTATVNNLGCQFEPHVLIGYKGGGIAAKNSDPVLHNTHLFLQQGNKDLVNIALPTQGQVIEKTLKKAGIVSVKCDAHEWMQAYVYASSNPYAVVSGKDGSFHFDGVPAGEYAVKVWHERLGEKDARVKVDAGGAAKLDIVYN